VPGLNKIIHERARLLILTYLASNEKKEISFNEIIESLQFSSGNLSVQLRKLEQAGYVTIHKAFKENKPYTTISITHQGADALKTYVAEMEEIIKALKPQKIAKIKDDLC
jgi:DNA-binding MarR family transcriptional regulator